MSHRPQQNLSTPPIYKVGGGGGGSKKKLNYQVPEFYGFEHTSTKWMLATLSTRTGLQRLALLAKEQPEVLSAYYQIPDRPIVISKKLCTLEVSAFNHLAILYVTPLALAIYCKQLEAVRILLRYKDNENRRLVHPNAPCFVQKLFKKGDFKLSNDLSNTYPVIIAIRRRFCEAIPLLMQAGYAPQREFSVIYRRAFREVVTYYRDIVDYLVDLLRTKPGNHVYVLMNAITNTVCPTTYDLFTFDVEENKKENGGGEQWVSIFRRIARLGVNSRYYNEESGMALITILEFIQKSSFFRSSLIPPRMSDSTTASTKNNQNSAMNNSPIKKVSRRDVLKSGEKDSQLEFDRNTCVGILVYWYQIVVIKRRPVQKDRVELLLSRVLLDTGLIEHFFSDDDNSLAELFSTWSEGATIRSETIACLKAYLPEKIHSIPLLAQQFHSRFSADPEELIAASNNNNNPGEYIESLKYNNRPLNLHSDAMNSCYLQSTKNANNHMRRKNQKQSNDQANASTFCVEQHNQSASVRPFRQDQSNIYRLGNNNTSEFTIPRDLIKAANNVNNNDEITETSRSVSIASQSRNSKRRGVCYMNIKHSRPDTKKFIPSSSPSIAERRSKQTHHRSKQGNKYKKAINNECYRERQSTGKVTEFQGKGFCAQGDLEDSDAEGEASSCKSTSIMTNLMACLETNLKKSVQTPSYRRSKDLTWINIKQ